MAELSRYIRKELIIPKLKAVDKADAIRQLVERIFHSLTPAIGDITLDSIYRSVINRESIQTTGLGNGLCFPHARLEKCFDLVLAIGISGDGVVFGSIDKQPCRIICLMLSPDSKPYIILQTMAALTRILADKQNVEAILRADSADKIVEILIKPTLKTSKNVVARDVMRPVSQSVNLETTIEQTAQIMHLRRIDVLPVIDSENTLRGEISCLKIFTYGIPDFFKQLETISFVRYLDPFEKYFKFRKNLTVKDLYEPTASSISMDATLIEMIFEMTAKNRSRLFVTNEGQLVGEVDRFSIIDKILFF
jgi:mannitol/fructose-specific phosphotransferase system IIA component (Ntr-type)